MHRIELFLRTLDEINANPRLLPNITLGCDIRDSCWYPPVALEQSIDFIKNSIASLENLNSSGGGGGHGPGPAATNGSCVQRKDKPIAGLIGPGSSSVTIQVQNLLSLFNIPQIGYSSTSKDLSMKSFYRYFLRVVPSDKLQAQALADLVHHFGWSFISTVSTEGNYGASGMQEFIGMARAFNICLAISREVSNNADDTAFDKVIDDLNSKSNARVVVCFCEGMTIRGLAIAAKRKNLDGHFLFIGSDGWNTRNDVVDDIEESIVGGMSIKLYSPEISDFDEYYLSLRPNNTRNPWFIEFWQERFRCYIEGPDRDERYTRACNGTEDLRTNYTQDAKLGFVVNAIYTMAYALDSMQKDVCGQTHPGLCDAMTPVNGTLFMKYLLNASFLSYSNDLIEFDESGDPPARYEIMNYQRISDDTSLSTKDRYGYVKIGSWQDGNLSVDDNLIFWPSRSAQSSAPVVESFCSRPCDFGQYKQLQLFHCCWVCNPCQAHEFLVNESACEGCPLGWQPNTNLTGCVMNEIERLEWNSAEALIALSISVIGLIATLWVTVVFCVHNNTAIVKASTRELSYIILIGISLSYAATFFLIATPTPLTCGAGRVIPGVSFSMVYGALVTKTNRIARILAGSKKKIMTRKLRFMSASAQVVITFIIVATECAIVGLSIAVYGGADSTLLHPVRNRTRLVCSESNAAIIVPFGLIGFLIAMCTVYAVKTRNLPENFNEAKFIGFTMYTTCVIWIAFVLIYFNSDSSKNIQVISKSLAISASSSVALGMLFGHKLYIIIYHPERNNRSAFTTAKGFRCHIGVSAASQRTTTSCDSVDGNRVIASPSTASGYTPWKTESSFSQHASELDCIHSEREQPQRLEDVAANISKQWNFLGRWRNKTSGRDVIAPANTEQLTSKQKVARGSYTHSISVPDNGVRSVSFKDRLKTLYLSPTDTDHQSVENSSFDDGKVASQAARPLGDVAIRGRVAGHPSASTSARQKDCAVQTDTELLSTMSFGLRQRHPRSLALDLGIGFSPKNQRPEKNSIRNSVRRVEHHHVNTASGDFRPVPLPYADVGDYRCVDVGDWTPNDELITSMRDVDDLPRSLSCRDSDDPLVSVSPDHSVLSDGTPSSIVSVYSQSPNPFRRSFYRRSVMSAEGWPRRDETNRFCFDDHVDYDEDDVDDDVDDDADDVDADDDDVDDDAEDNPTGYDQHRVESAHRYPLDAASVTREFGDVVGKLPLMSSSPQRKHRELVRLLPAQSTARSHHDNHMAAQPFPTDVDLDDAEQRDRSTIRADLERYNSGERRTVSGARFDRFPVERMTSSNLISSTAVMSSDVAKQNDDYENFSDGTACVHGPMSTFSPSTAIRPSNTPRIQTTPLVTELHDFTKTMKPVVMPTELVRTNDSATLRPFVVPNQTGFRSSDV